MDSRKARVNFQFAIQHPRLWIQYGTQNIVMECYSTPVASFYKSNNFALPLESKCSDPTIVLTLLIKTRVTAFYASIQERPITAN